MLSGAPAAPMSWTVLLTLLAALALSSLTYWVLVQRATSHRKWIALSAWARNVGYRYQPRALLQLPEPFGLLPDPRPQARICLTNGRTILLQMQGGPAATGVAARALHTFNTLRAV